eukprot:2853441-Pyramimonas_sp.AAC.1
MQWDYRARATETILLLAHDGGRLSPTAALRNKSSRPIAEGSHPTTLQTTSLITSLPTITPH